MKSSRLLLVFLLFSVFTIQIIPQTKLKKPSYKSPRLMYGAVIGYNYVVGSANGTSQSFPLYRDEISGQYSFDPRSFGMQQGGGLTFWVKKSINKKRTLHATGELGYNLFYNTRTKGLNRTRWNIIDIGAGIELSHKPTPRNRVFVGLELQYSLIFGAWQTDITYPDGYVSNIYVKIDPASRIGLALSSGMEFRTSKKSTFVVGIKGAWANLLPKGSTSPLTGYYTGLSDSKGITIKSRKDIIYLQLFTGVNFRLK